MKCLEISCVSPGCPERHISDPLDIENIPAADVWDFAETYMTRLGWTVDVSPAGGRGFLCPKCSAHVDRAMPTAPAEPIRVQAFACRPRCAKCGSRAVVRAHKTGIEGAAIVRCEHLLHACESCGYRWATACRDWRKARP